MTTEWRSACPIHNLLSPELREHADEAPHLMTYLHKVPLAEHGVPDFYPEASRKLGDIKDPNLIYRVGDNTYIHIFPDARGRAELLHRHRAGNDRMDDLLEEMEFRLLDFVEMLADARRRRKRRPRCC